MNIQFQLELARIINQYGIDDSANIPDHVLAQYIVDCVSSLVSVTEKAGISEKTAWGGSSFGNISTREEDMSIED